MLDPGSDGRDLFEVPDTFVVGAPPPAAGGGGDINPGGAASDPFDYTLGSLLTPWTEEFKYGGPAIPPGGYYRGTGGYSPMAPFQYKDFAFSFKAPEAYTGQADFVAPASFRGSRFAAPAGFKAPDKAQDIPDYEAPAAFQMKDLPSTTGFQFRLKEGTRALENAAASRGMLRSGNTWKELLNYGQEAASQEYAAEYARQFGEYGLAAELGLADYDRALAANEMLYGRAASEYDRMFQNALNVYQMGYQQDASEYDRTYGNLFAAHQFNQQNALNAWQANAATNLQSQGLGYQIASGVWDRNYGKDFASYQNMVQQAEVAAQIASAEAAAAAASAEWADQTAYGRALGEYGLRYDQFQNNQSNQFNRLFALAGLGQGSANQLTGAAGQFGANAGNLFMAGGNAGAAGQIGGANAWNTGLAGLNNAAQLAFYASLLQPPRLPYTMPYTPPTQPGVPPWLTGGGR